MTDMLSTSAEIRTGLFIGGEERQTAETLDDRRPRQARRHRRRSGFGNPR